MMARVRLRLSQHTGVWALPPAAIVSEKGQRSVWVVEAGHARKQPIKTGLEDERWVEIRQGVAGGEQVVTEGKEQIAGKGGPVRVR
jgi:membrane fusion protein (multidrug efflux system)